MNLSNTAKSLRTEEFEPNGFVPQVHLACKWEMQYTSNAHSVAGVSNESLLTPDLPQEPHFLTPLACCSNQLLSGLRQLDERRKTTLFSVFICKDPWTMLATVGWYRMICILGSVSSIDFTRSLIPPCFWCWGLNLDSHSCYERKPIQLLHTPGQRENFAERFYGSKANSKGKQSVRLQ